MKYVVTFGRETVELPDSIAVENFFKGAWVGKGNSIDEAINLGKAIVVIVHHEGSVEGDGFRVKLER